MKRLGLLGGMSWQSSVAYYRLINEETGERLGGGHSAEMLLYSVDFEPIERFQDEGDWASAGDLLATAAGRLESGGAEAVLLCTNTMHRVADRIREAISVPFLHIADATGERARAEGIGRVGLLGTRFTMEEDFYRGRLEERHGLSVLIPGQEDRAAVHRVIYDELCRGRIRESSRDRYTEIIRKLVDDGADGIVLGCTEITLLVGDDDSPVPLLDTTRIHCRAAVDFALGELPV